MPIERRSIIDDLFDDLSEAHGEATGAAVLPSDTLTAHDATKPLSDSLSASVSVLAPLYILGPELYDEVLKEIWKSTRGRHESQLRGMIYSPGHPFMFRDAEARARYVYENIVGLVWPCHKSEVERQKLYAAFTDGWADGSLEFLSGVPLAEVELYRQ